MSATSYRPTCCRRRNRYLPPTKPSDSSQLGLLGGYFFYVQRMADACGVVHCACGGVETRCGCKLMYIPMYIDYTAEIDYRSFAGRKAPTTPEGDAEVRDPQRPKEEAAEHLALARRWAWVEPLLARESCGHRLTLKRLRPSAKGVRHPPAAAPAFPLIHLQHTVPSRLCDTIFQRLSRLSITTASFSRGSPTVLANVKEPTQPHRRIYRKKAS